MRKRFLSANRPELTHDRRNVTFLMQENQQVAPSLFLVGKTPGLDPPPERAHTALAQAAGSTIAFQERRPKSSTVANLRITQAKPLEFQTIRITERSRRREMPSFAFRKQWSSEAIFNAS